LEVFIFKIKKFGVYIFKKRAKMLLFVVTDMMVDSYEVTFGNIFLQLFIYNSLEVQILGV